MLGLATAVPTPASFVTGRASTRPSPALRGMWRSLDAPGHLFFSSELPRVSFIAEALVEEGSGSAQVTGDRLGTLGGSAGVMSEAPGTYGLEPTRSSLGPAPLLRLPGRAMARVRPSNGGERLGRS